MSLLPDRSHFISLTEGSISYHYLLLSRTLRERALIYEIGTLKWTLLAMLLVFALNFVKSNNIPKWLLSKFSNYRVLNCM